MLEADTPTSAGSDVSPVDNSSAQDGAPTAETQSLAVPTDSVRGWHIDYLNLRTAVWPNYNGAGIRVAVNDDGFALGATEMAGNYDADADWDFSGNDGTPQAQSGDGHGTEVMSVIGAAADGAGIAGIAYGATLIGYRIGFGSWYTTQEAFAQAVAASVVNADVANNSWVFSGDFSDNFKYSNFFSGRDALVASASEGRDGLGTIQVFASGNNRAEGDMSNYHNYQNSPFTISVGAIGSDGKVTSFSNGGSDLLVVAPGASIIALDGSDGVGYTSVSGTSFAAPIVSAACALMLEANPCLGYRDVQEILAYSAIKTDPTATSWKINAAHDWNGGGAHFSNDYGFGLIDIAAATRMAESWSKQSVYANREQVSRSNQTDYAIPDGTGYASSSITITDDIRIQAVEISIDVLHGRRGDLTVEIVSPNGTVATLVDRPGGAGNTADNIIFTLEANTFWGESSVGTWQIRVYDKAGSYSGTLRGWSLNITGDSGADDVYVYTKEFSDVYDTSRATLTDTDGGYDVVNLAAQDTTVIFNLTANISNLVDGKILKIAAGSVIEGVIGGSGNDTLTGNTENNLIVGGAGNDTIKGGTGDDTLEGGSGNDNVYGDGGTDTAVFHWALANYTLTDLGTYYTVTGIDVAVADGTDKLYTMEYAQFSDVLINLYNFFHAVTTNAVDDAATVNEDGSVTIDLLGNDAGTSLALDSIVTGPLHGTLVTNADGTVTYTPDADFNGGDSFVYAVNGDSGSDTGTVTLTVNAVNDSPLALDKSLSLNEDGSVTIAAADLLAGASDVDGDSLSIVSISAPAHGNLVNNGNGTWTYTPAADFNGSEDLIFTVSDGHGGTVDKSLGITITAVNDAPLAADKEVSCGQGDAITFSAATLLSGASDTDGDSLVISSISAPAHGNLVDNGDGTWTYTSAGDFEGLENLTFTVSDGHGGSVDKTLGITVSILNNAPEATDKSLSLDEDASVTFSAASLLAGASDADGDVLSIASISAPAHGALIDNGDDTWTYTPDADYNGNETLSYTVSDGRGGSVVKSLTLTVNAVNDAPLADDKAISTDEDTAITFSAASLLAGASDVDGDVLSIASISAPVHGTLVDNGDDTWTYTPAPNFNGSEILTVTVTDGNGANTSQTLSLTVNSVNDAPIATDQAFSLNEDGSYTFSGEGLLAGTSDVDGGTLTVSSVGEAVHGTVVDNGNGTWTYTPDANYNGADSLSFTVIDGQGGTVEQTVSFSVTAVNDAPVGSDHSFNLSEDTPVTFSVDDLLAGSSDVDGDILSVIAITDPSHGGLVNNGDGTWTYTPDANYYGSDSVSFTLSDGHGGTVQKIANFAIGSVNDEPVVIGKSMSLDEDTSLIITADDLLAGSSDADGDGLSIVSISGNSHGTLVDNGDQTWTYTPASNFNGSETLTVTVTDGNGGNVSQALNLTVNPVNDVPTAAGKAMTLDEDSSVTFTAAQLLDGASDADGDELSISGVAGASHGVLVDNGDETWTYTPDANFHGVDNLVFTIADGNGGSVEKALDLTVSPVNDAPSAADKALSTNEDTPITFSAADLLVGSADLDGDVLSISSIGEASHGMLTDNGNGLWTYTPSTDFNGSETISYTVADGMGGSVTKTIVISVNPVNDAPTASDHTIALNEDGSVNFSMADLLEGSSDVDGDGLTVVSIGNPSHGSVVDNGDGTRTYTPAADFNGSDSVTYTVSDGQGGSIEKTIFFTVAAINDAPVAIDHTISTGEDTAVTFAAADLLAGASDVDGDVLTIASLGSPSHGVASANGDGTWTYTPEANFHGSDSLTFTIADGNGATIEKTLSFTVGSANDAPVTTDHSFVLEQNGSAMFGVSDLLAGASDVDGDVLSISAIGTPSHGGLTNNGDGTWSYVPAENYFGTDTVTFVVSDGQGGSIEKTVSFDVTRINIAPVGSDKAFVTDEDTAITFSSADLLAGASDFDGDTLTISGIAGATHGTTTDNGDGTWTYSPVSDFSGTDTLTFTIDDGFGGHASQTITIAVNAVNDAPVAVDKSISINEDTAITFSAAALLDGVTDVEGDALTIASISAPSHGDLVDNGDGTWTYTPTADYNGNETLSFVVSDGQGGVSTKSLEITVNAVNDTPVAVDHAVSVDEDGSVTFSADDLLAGATDVDGNDLSIASISAPAHGTLVDNGNGTWTYTPDADFNGSETLAFSVSDGHGATAERSLGITINAVNDAPVASDHAISTDEDTAVTFSVNDLLSDASDVEGDALTIASISTPSHGDLVDNGDGTWTYTPDADFNGAEALSFVVSDGQGGSVSKSLNIAVNAVNDAPVATDHVISTSEDTAVTFSAAVLLVGSSDVDGDTLSIASIASPAHGTLIDNGDGSWTYTPDVDFNGSETLSFVVSDGQGGMIERSLVIGVDAVNDVPTAIGHSISTNEDSFVSFAGDDLLSGASDVDGNDLTISAVGNGAHGTVVDDGNNTWSYHPDADFNGSDSFTYTVSDGHGGTVEQTVNVTVDAVNDTPVSGGESFVTDEDTSVTISANDLVQHASDIDGDTLSVTMDGAPTHGNLTDNGDDTWTYTPDAEFSGNDSFTFTLADGNGGTVDVTAGIVINPVNDAPTGLDHPFSTDEDMPITITAADLLGGSSDIEGDNLSISSVSAPSHGTLIDNGDQSWTYAANPDYNGADSFTFSISDGNGGTIERTASLTINSVEDAPVGQDQIFGTVQDHAVTITAANLLNGAHDGDGDTMSVSVSTDVEHGILTDNGDQTWTYTPDDGFTGSDNFAFTISDTNGNTATQTGMLLVTQPPAPAQTPTESVAIDTSSFRPSVAAMSSAAASEPSSVSSVSGIEALTASTVSVTSSLMDSGSIWDRSQDSYAFGDRQHHFLTQNDGGNYSMFGGGLMSGVSSVALLTGFAGIDAGQDFGVRPFGGDTSANTGGHGTLHDVGAYGSSSASVGIGSTWGDFGSDWIYGGETSGFGPGSSGLGSGSTPSIGSTPAGGGAAPFDGGHANPLDAPLLGGSGADVLAAISPDGFIYGGLYSGKEAEQAPAGSARIVASAVDCASVSFGTLYGENLGPAESGDWLYAETAIIPQQEFVPEWMAAEALSEGMSGDAEGDVGHGWLGTVFHGMLSVLAGDSFGDHPAAEIAIGGHIDGIGHGEAAMDGMGAHPIASGGDAWMA